MEQQANLFSPIAENAVAPKTDKKILYILSVKRCGHNLDINIVVPVQLLTKFNLIEALQCTTF